MEYEELRELGRQLRVDSIRAAAAAGSGRPTSSNSPSATCPPQERPPSNYMPQVSTPRRSSPPSAPWSGPVTPVDLYRIWE